MNREKESLVEEYRHNFNHAEMLRDTGRINEAYAAYYNLLQFRLEWEQSQPGLPFTLNEFFIVDRLANLSLLTGNKSAARNLLAAMGNLTRLSGNKGMRIHAITKLVLVNLNAGLLDDANVNIKSLSDIIGDIETIQISPTGLPDWENLVCFNQVENKQDHADQLVCLYDALAALLLALGRFEEGILMLQRGIQIAELNRSPVVNSRLLPMKIFRAKALFEKGEIHLAKTSLAKIETETAAAKISSGIAIHVLNLKSKIALAQGEMGEAYNLLFKTVQLCRNYSLSVAEINANFNLAQTKILLNQVGDAADILQDCLTNAEKIGEKTLAYRIKLFLQVADNRSQPIVPALNYSGLKQKTWSSVRIVKELPMEPTKYIRPEDYLSFFEEKALIFQMQLAESHPDKAADILNELRLLVSKCDSVLIHSRFQVLEFMLLHFSNKPFPKELPIQSVLKYLSTNHLLPELWQFRRLLVHTNLVAETDKAKWIDENQHLLDEITKSLPPEMQALYLLNKWSTNEEFFGNFSDELSDLMVKIKTTKFFPARWLAKWTIMKRLLLFQEYLKSYKDHLARNIAKGLRAEDLEFHGFKSKGLRKLGSQPKDTLSISFLVLPDRVVIVSRSFLKIRLHVTYINRVILRQLLFSLRDNLYPNGKLKSMFEEFSKPEAEPIDFRELLQQLKNILRVEDILKEYGEQIHHVVFVADDVLHGFPFSLLELNGKSILDKVRISISTEDGLPQRKPINISSQKVLLTGVSNSYLDLPSLPGVLREIDKINLSMKAAGAEVKILMNEKATVSETKKNLKEADIAHFSCHGKFDFKHPDQSGLVLARGELLTLKEILPLDGLSKIRLIVLSSCRGAEHYIFPGRWIIGLPETFCRAGVKVVVAFLWPVVDEFATCFTSRFYEHLNNVIPSEAFRLTVLEAKNKQFSGLSSQYWEPRFWAGAIYYER